MTAKFSKKIYDTYPYLRTIKEMPESELLLFLLYLRADTLTKVNDVAGLDKDVWNEMLSRGMPAIECATETLLNDVAEIISDHNYDGVSFRNLENVHRILRFCKGYEHIIIRRTEGEVSTVVEGEEHIDKIIEEITAYPYTTYGTSVSQCGNVMSITTNQDVHYMLRRYN